MAKAATGVNIALGGGLVPDELTGKGAQGLVGGDEPPTGPLRAWQDALAAVRLEVSAVEKTGTAPVSAGGYGYVTRDEVVGYGAPLLAKQGLSLVPGDTYWESATDKTIDRINEWSLEGHGYIRHWKDRLPVTIHRDVLKENQAADSYIEKYRYLRVLGIPRSDEEIDPDAYEADRGRRHG